MKWIAVILVIVVSGCATESISDLKFIRWDDTKQEYREATQECGMKAQRAQNQKEMYIRCMEAKGYQLVRPNCN